MFVNMSPALAQAEETVCSLNFASRVRSVELGQATKHVGPSAAGAPAAAGVAATAASSAASSPRK